MKPIIPALILSSCLALSAAFAAPAESSTQTVHEETSAYAITYPVVIGDSDAAAAINADIAARAAYAVKASEWAPPSRSTGFYFREKMEDERYLSLLFFSELYRKEDHRLVSLGAGVVYDKETGEKVPLARFADVTVEDLVRLYKEGKCFRHEGQEVSGEGAKLPTRVPEDYFLTIFGDIFVLFDVGEVASLADGHTAIKVTSLKKP